MKAIMNQLQEKVVGFVEDAGDRPDLGNSVISFLLGEIANDFTEKGIRSFGDWLRHYSTNGNDFNDVRRIADSYVMKVMKQDFDETELNEKILMYNAAVLYSVEMDVDCPTTGPFFNKIMYDFLTGITNYGMSLQGYLLVEGEILLSDKSKYKYSFPE